MNQPAQNTVGVDGTALGWESDPLNSAHWDTAANYTGTPYSAKSDVRWRVLASEAAHQTWVHHFGLEFVPGTTMTYAQAGSAIWANTHLTAQSRAVRLDNANAFDVRFISGEMFFPQRHGTMTFDQFRWSCKVTPPTTFSVETLSSDQWTYGALAAAGDTRMFVVQGHATKDTIVLVSSAYDIDLYMRKGALPTRTVYDVRKASDSPGEYIRIPAGDTSSFFVAVQSYDSEAWYQAKISRVKPNNAVSVPYGTSPVQPIGTPLWLEDAAVAAEGARGLFGMTNGQVVAKLNHAGWSTDIFDVCVCDGVPCKLCFQHRPGRSHALYGGVANMHPEDGSATGVFFGWTVAHEFGHNLLGLGDEYVDHPWDTHSDGWCSKSQMDGFFSNVLCVAGRHNTVMSPQTHTCTSGTPRALLWWPSTGACPNYTGTAPATLSNFEVLAVDILLDGSRTLEQPSGQLENVDYTDFVFLDELFDEY